MGVRANSFLHLASIAPRLIARRSSTTNEEKIKQINKKRKKKKKKKFVKPHYVVSNFARRDEQFSPLGPVVFAGKLTSFSSRVQTGELVYFTDRLATRTREWNLPVEIQSPRSMMRLCFGRLVALRPINTRTISMRQFLDSVRGLSPRTGRIEKQLQLTAKS